MDRISILFLPMCIVRVPDRGSVQKGFSCVDDAFVQGRTQGVRTLPPQFTAIASARSFMSNRGWPGWRWAMGSSCALAGSPAGAKSRATRKTT